MANKKVQEVKARVAKLRRGVSTTARTLGSLKGNVRGAVKGLVSQAKQNAFYYGVGKRVEAAESRKNRAESNIRGVMQANPEMGKRMQEEYKKLKKQGKY